MKFIRNLIKGNNPRTLLAFNVLLFLFLCGSPFLVSFSWLGAAGSLVMYFCMICLGVSVTYHRALTHKALKLHPILEKIFVTFACMSGTGSPIMWVMTHREHHRYSDKPGDPHPPESVWKTFFGAYPRVSSYGIRDIARTKYYAWWHRYYFAILGSIAFALALIGMQAFFYLFAVPVFLSITASNVLNWFGHSQAGISYRNFNEVPDHSQNNAVLGLFIFGEGWHNNHHKYPGSSRFGLRKFELDISYAMIKICQALGLATNVRVAKI